mmetsp:Transcript_4252/g.6757  ORF Transcript_4252/g.6757 Transcript_4252/m.6757 type:complete len:462 (-) Transcript_4252:263-1648(-)
MGSCSSKDKEEDHDMGANNGDGDSDSDHILGMGDEGGGEEEEKLDPKDFMAKKLRGKQVTRGPGTIKGQSFTIDNCKACTIFLCDNTAAVTIDDCRDCVFFIAPCESSVFIRNCKDCKMVVACRQFRTRECEGVDVMLYCAAGQPIIEMSSKIRFTGFNYSYFKLGAQFRAARMNVWDTEWSNVFDFTKSSSMKNNSTGALIDGDNNDEDQEQQQQDNGSSNDRKETDSSKSSFSFLTNKENNENWGFLPLGTTAKQLLGNIDVCDLIEDIKEAEMGLECPVPPSWGNRRLHPQIMMMTTQQKDQQEQGRKKTSLQQRQQHSSSSSSSSGGGGASSGSELWETCFLLTAFENEEVLRIVREMISDDDDKTTNILMRRSRTRDLGQSEVINLVRNLKSSRKQKSKANDDLNKASSSLLSAGGVYVGIELIGKSCIEVVTKSFCSKVVSSVCLLQCAVCHLTN